MKYRLLIITFLSIICAAFTDVADNLCYVADNLLAQKVHQDQSEIESTILPSCCSAEISSTSNDILAARQNNFTTNAPTRTLTKRTSAQRSLGKFQVYISAGKTVCPFNFEIYQIINNLLPSGLCDIHRHLISLGKLII